MDVLDELDLIELEQHLKGETQKAMEETLALAKRVISGEFHDGKPFEGVTEDTLREKVRKAFAKRGLI